MWKTIVLLFYAQWKTITRFKIILKLAIWNWNSFLLDKGMLFDFELFEFRFSENATYLKKLSLLRYLYKLIIKLYTRMGLGNYSIKLYRLTRRISKYTKNCSLIFNRSCNIVSIMIVSWLGMWNVSYSMFFWKNTYIFSLVFIFPLCSRNIRRLQTPINSDCLA